MTIKQGEDINKRFTLLTDSIKKINDNLNHYVIENNQKLQKVYIDYNSELSGHKSTRIEADSFKNMYLMNKKIYLNAEEDHRREIRNLSVLTTVFFFIAVLFAAN